ncbi:small conductance mechanosensitive channel [Ancylobacter aquaticus]|uniref:Small-conductance mechanosensitive channel n=1 Tax=Ancylobacter aquaticus TaxID=100 RepID=A0A4R1IBY9_ANCAQ|nr:mechanosensitive ion channel domain-containing protein [Ancylobacter aquaticus]TCK31685.1 small conductance mechanosensitive channel [Ancylobacter aquaticus]
MNLDQLGNLFILYGLNVLYALAMLLIGWWIAGLVERLVLRGLGSTRRVDSTVAGFLASIARYGILVFVGVAVLQRFGIQTTSIIAVLGATSLAVGLALQGTLSNVAAGVMLLLFRPFKVGDAVEVGGQSGTVKALSLFTTELAAGDNVQVLMPNGRVWGAPIVNKSVYGTRSFAFALELKPDADIEGVMEKALAFLRGDPRVSQSPGPSASIAKLGLDRVEIGFSGWAAAGDAGGVRGDLIRRLREMVRDPQSAPVPGVSQTAAPVEPAAAAAPEIPAKAPRRPRASLSQP